MSKNQQSPNQRRYSSEFRERAVRMVRQLRTETGVRQGTIGRVADQLGCGVESLRSWVKPVIHNLCVYLGIEGDPC